MFPLENVIFINITDNSSPEQSTVKYQVLPNTFHACRMFWVDSTNAHFVTGFP